MDNKSTGTASNTLHLAKCPACKGNITAYVEYEFTLGAEAVGNEVVTAMMRPSCLVVNHNCRKNSIR